MDYQGQKAAELLLTRVLIAFAAAGFLIGYMLSNFALMCYINLAGVAVALLLVVPDWPYLNKQPLQWLAALNPGKQKKEEDVSTPQQQEAQQQLTPAIKPSRSRKV
jgi:signal peptidase complex subunit 1